MFNPNYRGIRNDINHFTIDIYTSNICRIFLYEKKEYIVNEEEFEVEYDKFLKPDIIDITGLFGKPKSLLIYVNKINSDFAFKINMFKRLFKDKNLIIISPDINNTYDIKIDIDYNELEKIYKPILNLWEDSKQNIYTKSQLYTRSWIVNSKELKRKHPNYFNINNKGIKIGQNWKRPSQIGYHGKPKNLNNEIITTFRIVDEKGNIFESDSNWGVIISRIGQIIKDNSYPYYNTGKGLIIEGYSKKSYSWYQFVKYDAINNYWN